MAKTIKILGITLAVLFVLLLALYWSGYGGRLALSMFVAANGPDGNFDPARVAPAPDYSAEINWAALPGKADPSDLVPSGVAPPAESRPVDTFFIHPTGFSECGRLDIADGSGFRDRRKHAVDDGQSGQCL